MRESSQKEVEFNREPLPPGEQQVEVERAWLIGRDSVVRSTETTSHPRAAKARPMLPVPLKSSNSFGIFLLLAIFPLAGLDHGSSDRG